MSSPNDPWGQRPGDSPTERLGAPGEEQTKPYGGDSFDQWGQPSNPTRALPPHDAQWGGYESGGYPGDQPLAQPAHQPGYPAQPQYGAPRYPGPPGGAPPGGPQPERPRRNTGLWIALGLGVVALVAVVGVLAGLVFAGGGSDEDTTAAGVTTTQATRPPATTPRTTSPTDTSGIPGFPGLPGTADTGATMGTISANTGTTITLDTLNGKTLTVQIDAATQVISLSSTTAAELPVGDMVMVQGDKNPDGSIHAKIIISTALPGGPR